MPTEKTSALAKLTPEERKKVISMAAEMTLTTAILKRRAARQAKLREEIKAERQKKQN